MALAHLLLHIFQLLLVGGFVGRSQLQLRLRVCRNLRQTLAMEARAMEKLSAEAVQRKAEIEALQAEKEKKQKEVNWPPCNGEVTR